MKDKEFFSRVLGLAEPWRVKEVRLDLEGKRVDVEIECRAGEVWAGQDGRRLHIHGWEQRQWRHLDTMQLETIIGCRVPRVVDPETGATVMVEVPWAAGPRSRWTLLFEAWAVQVLEAVPALSRACGLLGIDWHAARAIKQRAVERGLERRAQEQGAIEHIGIDEKSFGKGQDYISCAVDIDGRRVLEVVAGRTQEAAAELLRKALPEPGARAGVRAACIDMWAAFEAALGEVLPQADIVFDPFHVVSHAGKAVDEVRRAEHRRLAAEGASVLKGTRQLWLWGREKLDREQRRELGRLLEADLNTGLAWALKEDLRRLWDFKRPSAARDFLDTWLAKAEASGLAPVKRVAAMIASHLPGVMAWFWHRISNGVAEGFNSAIQAIKSSARGFRTFANYRIAILFHCGGLQLFPH